MSQTFYFQMSDFMSTENSVDLIKNCGKQWKLRGKDCDNKKRFNDINFTRFSGILEWYNIIIYFAIYGFLNSQIHKVAILYRQVSCDHKKSHRIP